MIFHWESYLAHDLLLGHDMLLLAGFHDLRLFHLLQRERSRLVLGQLDQLDAAEAAHAESGDHAQVGQPYVTELLVDPGGGEVLDYELSELVIAAEMT